MSNMGFNVDAGFTGSKPRFTPHALSNVLIANRGEIALRLVSIHRKSMGYVRDSRPDRYALAKHSPLRR